MSQLPLRLTVQVAEDDTAGFVGPMAVVEETVPVTLEVMVEGVDWEAPRLDGEGVVVIEHPIDPMAIFLSAWNVRKERDVAVEVLSRALGFREGRPAVVLELRIGSHGVVRRAFELAVQWLTLGVSAERGPPKREARRLAKLYEEELSEAGDYSIEVSYRGVTADPVLVRVKQGDGPFSEAVVDRSR